MLCGAVSWVCHWVKRTLRIQKNDINTGIGRYGVAKHLLNICRSSVGKFEICKYS